MFRRDRERMGLSVLVGLRCLLTALVLAASPALAQSGPVAQPAPPPAMSQQQMDQMVDAISQSVMKKMQEQGAQPQPAAGPGMQMASAEQTQMFMHIGGLVTGLPSLFAELVHFAERLDAPMNNGRGLRPYFMMLLGAILAALAAEWLTRLLLTPLRRRAASHMRGLSGIRALVALAVLEIPPLLALWLVGNAS